MYCNHFIEIVDIFPSFLDQPIYIYKWCKDNENLFSHKLSFQSTGKLFFANHIYGPYISCLSKHIFVHSCCLPNCYLITLQRWNWTWPFIDFFLLEGKEDGKDQNQKKGEAKKAVPLEGKGRGLENATEDKRDGEQRPSILTCQWDKIQYKWEELFPTKEVDFDGRKVMVPK